MDRYSLNKREVIVFITILLATLFLLKFNLASAQGISSNQYKLSLSEAIQYAKSQNKWVQAAITAENAAGEDLKDAYNAALPSVNASASYQRFSDLSLFTNGLEQSTTGPRKPTPNAAALGLDALFNIYSGGRQRAMQSEQEARLKLAELNTQDQAGYIALQTAAQYLELVRLNDLHKFIQDQLKRAQTRLGNINSLYRNQKVTRSDVLRAEVMLSNVELTLQQNENDIIIANQKLNVLMNLPDSVSILPTDSAGMPKPETTALLPLLEETGDDSYAIQKSSQNIQVQRARVRSIQSYSMPSLSFYTAYGLNYPNYLFFPPIDQAYTIGFVGLRAQYGISSLYHNKSKIAASQLRVQELQLQQQAVGDNVRTEANAHYIKYIEALNRIMVNERSVAQAQENYRIVSTKYFNQLALLTDLLDADSLYQESRFDLIRAQTDALAIYYRLLYTSGKL
ncbi:TolC family protein [Pontibacter harenae]|uniref:TolC family protein n=1 Tax=Pontibacter harenae TaxID=2894083 RepID=UPI001E639EFF|nr:TolC family protein [Pontibacter harenae]